MSGLPTGATPVRAEPVEAPAGTSTGSVRTEAAARSRGYWGNVGARVVRDPVFWVAATIVLSLLAMALFGPWIAPADPQASSMMARLKPIGTDGYPLGSDELGRDMLSRLIVGARLSLFMGITPVFYAFPSVLLAIALSGALGAGIGNALLSLTIVFIPPIARVAESVTTQVRNRDYVEAARASGANAFTIVRVHVLGNVLGPIFVYATSLIAVSMILASGLSFLGLGVKPPEPEWGLMLNTLRTAIYVQPWVAALPGAMIFITSIAFNLLSDSLRAAMDNK